MSESPAVPLAREALLFNEEGLLPAIVQDARTGEVLMLAWMNAESVSKSVETGDVWFFSRSRQELWHKGATSGDRLRLRWLRVDCDGDTLLLGVDPVGAGACHVEGRRSCFWRELTDVPFDDGASFDVLSELARVIAERRAVMPEGSYTTALFRGGVDRVGKKVGEEAVEVVLAAKNHERQPGVELGSETADLLYHLLVLAELVGLEADAVYRELARRRGRSSVCASGE
jgi:phosphoribosyl-AMP cyclohydrolase / phosphoribosyl-ATP pyrophosphohydrolase